MRSRNSMEKGQEEMKDRMEKGQEEMKKGQEEMKNRSNHLESKVVEIKDIVNSCIEKIEDVQSVKERLERPEKNRFGQEERKFLFSASAEHLKLCSVLARENYYTARSECLIQGVPSFWTRYAVTDFLAKFQKGVLVVSTSADLKREAIPFEF
ncbi:hypothetical protein AVEN_266477-1 [Araneus ventricosus]|uniref:Uncharacterized protein n=1 Tax=Araneus ventricosus TaxID=182803 RepID=A0A4Y2E0E7_ARAVE|nr:hypothetical protein AVEN_266477-1 [Araneus ventricosus]